METRKDFIKGALSRLSQFLATESRLKMKKNAFYFNSKAFFVLNFLSWIFGHAAKRLDQKDRINVKFYDVIAWLINILIHLLPNISISKGNQTMKSGQLIEYNTRQIFLAKSYTECGGETSPRPFFEKLKLSMYLLINSLKFHTVCFYCMPS